MKCQTRGFIPAILENVRVLTISQSQYGVHVLCFLNRDALPSEDHDKDIK